MNRHILRTLLTIVLLGLTLSTVQASDLSRLRAQIDGIIAQSKQAPCYQNILPRAEALKQEAALRLASSRQLQPKVAQLQADFEAAKRNCNVFTNTKEQPNGSGSEHQNNSHSNVAGTGTQNSSSTSSDKGSAVTKVRFELELAKLDQKDVVGVTVRYGNSGQIENVIYEKSLPTGSNVNEVKGEITPISEFRENHDYWNEHTVYVYEIDYEKPDQDLFIPKDKLIVHDGTSATDIWGFLFRN